MEAATQAVERTYVPQDEKQGQFVDWVRAEYRFWILCLGLLLIGWVATIDYRWAMWIGFGIVAPAAIANDAIQIFSAYFTAEKNLPWKWSAAIFSTVMGVVHIWGWVRDSGSVSFGLLDRIAMPERFTVWHMAAAVLLLLFTRYKAPVSNTMLILGAFGDERVFNDVFMKSSLGLVCGLITSIVIFGVILQLERRGIVARVPADAQRWLRLLLSATCILFWGWLINDTAHFAVYLPRHLSGPEVCAFLAICVAVISVLCWKRLFNIRSIVGETYGMDDSQPIARLARSTALLMVSLAFVLFVLHDYMHVPLSSSFVFIGVLAGRDLLVTFFVPGEFKGAASRFGKNLALAMLGALTAYGISVANHALMAR